MQQRFDPHTLFVTVVTFVAMASILGGSFLTSPLQFSSKVTTQIPNQSTPTVANANLPSALYGKVLHRAVYYYNYATGGIDPANGQIITSDQWFTIGANGDASLFQALNELPDGSILQEIVQTPTETTLFFGKAYLKEFPFQCLSVDSSTSSLQDQLPSFIDEGSLSKLNYTKSKSQPTKRVPITNSLSSVSPTITYQTGSTVDHWNFAEVSAGTIHDSWFDISMQGRVSIGGSRLTNDKGTVLNETWISSGSLEAYNQKDVPQSVFKVSHQNSTGCLMKTNQYFPNVTVTGMTKLIRPLDWSGWSCNYDVQVLIDNGILSGEACENWSTSSFQWEVESATVVQPSYAIQTTAYGWDTCTGTWTFDMSGSGTTYNNTVGYSGNPAIGPYMSCLPNQDHEYLEWNVNLAKPNSSSPWEGSSGYLGNPNY